MPGIWSVQHSEDAFIVCLERDLVTSRLPGFMKERINKQCSTEIDFCFWILLQRSTNQFRTPIGPWQGGDGQDVGVMVDAAGQVVVGSTSSAWRAWTLSCKRYRVMICVLDQSMWKVDFREAEKGTTLNVYYNSLEKEIWESELRRKEGLKDQADFFFFFDHLRKYLLIWNMSTFKFQGRASLMV